MVLAAIGVALGMLGWLATSRVLASYLDDFVRADIPTLSLAGAAMTLIASLACYAPARRAIAADPLRSLRVE
jgi:predicted lysophospholipase L1 biosynthesis ABC-type transport system permease subunit